MIVLEPPVVEVVQASLENQPANVKLREMLLIVTLVLAVAEIVAF